MLLQPRSRGYLSLKSAEQLQQMTVHPHYMDDAEDERRILIGMRRMRQIIATEPMASRVVAEQLPGMHVTSDADLLEHVRNQGSTAWHPVGTCRMGVDENAVVDSRLRVRGVECLRVADASIMPRITSGNTSAPAVMIGEKVADMIRQACE